jgi:adenosylcobinamide-phosphate synthase
MAGIATTTMLMARDWAGAAGLAAGYALDEILGDPRRWHPVSGYGRTAATLEKALYAPTHGRGVAFAAVAVAAPVAVAVLAQHATRRRPVARFVFTAATTWAVLGGRSLRREGARLASTLERGDIAAARALLPNLCGRDSSGLGAPELTRAATESVAENTSDAVVAPLFWGALLGLPGLAGYRAINTLDAMVGHRSARYERFGTAAARLDDAANLAPSRLTAALSVAVGGAPQRTWRTWRRDGSKHPSPNSGQCEAAFAGALGVRLGGTNVYFGRSEHRPGLGDGPPPQPRDLRRAARLSGLVGLATLALAVTYRASRRGPRWT